MIPQLVITCICIFDHVGKFELPVTQLIPPSATRILRKVDSTFVRALKGNIKHDPLGTGVPAAVTFTNQVTKVQFLESLKDAYTYEVAGGFAWVHCQEGAT